MRGRWLGRMLVAAAALARPAWAIEAHAPGKGHAMQSHKSFEPHADLASAEAAAKARQAALVATGAPIHLERVVPFGAGVVEEWRLDNGLGVLLAVDPLVPVVAVQTWLRVGSADESAGKTGLAHLFEHLMFKSTRTQPAGTLDRVLEQMGGAANAATSLDYTFFQETVPTAHVPTVLALEADRLVNLDLTAAAFRSELSVVRNERREVVDNDPDGQMDEAMSELAWGSQPYGHPVIGSPADLAALTVADARAFYAQYYGAGRATLVLAGGFDPARLLQGIVEHYGGLPAGTPQAPPRAEAPTGAAQRTVVVDAGAERAAVAWRLPPGDHADAVALEVLAEVLGSGDSARLAKALLFAQPIASAVSADVSDARLGSLLQVHVTLLPGERGREALERVDAVVRALLGSQPTSEAELTAAKNRLKMAYFSSLAHAEGRAEQLGHALLSYGSLEPALQFPARLAAVTTGDVQRVAHAYLIAERRVVVLGELPPPKVARKRAEDGRRG